MNTLEGSSASASIIGPAVLAQLLAARRAVDMAVHDCRRDVRRADRHRARRCSIRTSRPAARRRGGTGRSMRVKNPYVLAFSAAVFLYVGVEAAIYVWMPTLLAGYRGRRHDAGGIRHLGLLSRCARRDVFSARGC